jgi:hypothetical protein
VPVWPRAKEAAAVTLASGVDSDNYSGRNFNLFNGKHGGFFAAVSFFEGGNAER